jgi:hypothetical protein
MQAHSIFSVAREHTKSISGKMREKHGAVNAIGYILVLPSPSWPFLFLPQHLAAPLLSRAQVKLPPALTGGYIRQILDCDRDVVLGSKGNL